MENLVLISHGKLSDALKDSAEMIMGKQDNIFTVCLVPEDGATEFEEKLGHVISGLENFVVFSDLLGGTPCNVASKFILSGETFPLYAGMSLPMVINFINASLGVEIDIISEAQNGIVKVNDLLDAMDEDDE